MYLKLFLMGLFVLPINAFAATGRTSTTASRVGVQRAPNMVMSSASGAAAVTQAQSAAAVPTAVPTNVVEQKSEPMVIPDSVQVAVIEPVVENTVQTVVVPEKQNCRENYRNCMDQFCLLAEEDGNRCACSDAIANSQIKLDEIMEIQNAAELLYTEGVEREMLGAKADLVFAKEESASSAIDFTSWMVNTTEEVEIDSDVGANLYSMAADSCSAELAACGDKSDMEELLYSRQITQDCKAYDSYLDAQKIDAENNKKIAEAAVRSARLEMLDVTNLYSRGECLLAYKSCISDKGGCGINFENCMDAELLERRSFVCENVLDQCMASKDEVMDDWQAESKMLLAEAAVYSDKNKRQTCFAQIQLCLEDGCSTSSNPACLNDINVAAGVCPIIDECDALVPGIKTAVAADLGYVRVSMCQSDVDKCLQDKCGKNFNNPECLGKSSDEIVALCPQTIMPNCAAETQFDLIVQAAVLQMDYQMVQGCVNHFADQLSRTCGSDMSCLPDDIVVTSLTVLPEDETSLRALRETVINNSRADVTEFFTKLESDASVVACQDSAKNPNQKSLGVSVFETSKIIAEIEAENRALRALDAKIAELSRAQSLEDAEETCYATYPIGDKTTSDDNLTSYSYVESVVFEPSLRNCRVCRIQQVCEVGGMSKAAAGLQAAAGGLAAGAGAGTMIAPGWGTAIGGAIGAVGAGVMGGIAGGKEKFCQQMSVCEDVNM